MPIKKSLAKPKASPPRPPSLKKGASAAPAPRVGPKKKVTQVSKSPVERTWEVASDLNILRGEAKIIDGKIKATQNELLGLLAEQQVTTMTNAESGMIVTVVTSERTTVDDAALRAQVSDSVWKAITKTVIDPHLLEQAVAGGKLAASVVAACSTTKGNAPYVKVTEAKP